MNSNSTIKVRKSKLEGKVRVSGAKNSSLRLLAASIMTDQKVELNNFPNGLLDVQVHLKMLKVLGKKVESISDKVIIENNDATGEVVRLDWDGRSIRNTLLILGALTAKLGEGRVPLPGGCKLGERKYDLHVMLLERLGAKVWEEDGFLCAKSNGRLVGTDIFLPMRSTGATENAIICGSLASGKTTVWNPHIRPEILDLIDMLRKMGATITVYGQKCIEIIGCESLKEVKHSVIPDNMEALTWAIGATITNGDVEILDFPYEHLEVPLVFLRESGMKFYRSENSLLVRGGMPYPIEISTGPYPGINSDMQPLFAVYGAMCQGQSKIVDLRFPGRYGYADELAKMNMNSTTEGDFLVINGGNQLVGTNVTALDLRAGIALLLAGLTAEGETTINNAWQVGRGYENLEEKLKGLNADIQIS